MGSRAARLVHFDIGSRVTQIRSSPPRARAQLVAGPGLGSDWAYRQRRARRRLSLSSLAAPFISSADRNLDTGERHEPSASTTAHTTPSRQGFGLLGQLVEAFGVNRPTVEARIASLPEDLEAGRSKTPSSVPISMPMRRSAGRPVEQHGPSE